MKKLSAALILCVSILTFSCSSDSNSSSNNDDTYIKFKVNGTQFNIIEPSTISSLATNIFALEDDGTEIRNISLQMPNDATVGTHPLAVSNGSDLQAYSASYGTDSGIDVDSESGSLIISSIGSEYIEGTFSFTGTSGGTTYTISEGKFRAFKPSDPN